MPTGVGSAAAVCAVVLAPMKRQPAAALPSDQAGGGVQDAVAQSFRFGGGQLAVQAEDL
jgi:hypothetical protein